MGEEEIVPAVLEDSGCEGDGGKTKKKKKGKKEKVAKEEVPVCPTTSSNADTHQHTTPQTESATGKKKKSTIKEEKTRGSKIKDDETTGGGEKDISFGFPGSNILSIEGYGVFCSSSNDANTHQPTTPNTESVAENENKFTIKEEKTTGSTIEQENMTGSTIKEEKTTGSTIEEVKTTGGGE